MIVHYKTNIWKWHSSVWPEAIFPPSRWFNISFTLFCYRCVQVIKTKLTITVEKLKPIMDPIVGLFPHRFLWKFNQTQQVRANKSSPPAGTFCCASTQLDIFRHSKCNQIFTSLLKTMFTWTIYPRALKINRILFQVNFIIISQTFFLFLNGPGINLYWKRRCIHLAYEHNGCLLRWHNKK